MVFQDRAVCSNRNGPAQKGCCIELKTVHHVKIYVSPIVLSNKSCALVGGVYLVKTGRMSHSLDFLIFFGKYILYSTWTTA